MSKNEFSQEEQLRIEELRQMITTMVHEELEATGIAKEISMMANATNELNEKLKKLTQTIGSSNKSFRGV